MENFANNPQTTLTADIDNSQTTISVPNPVSGFPSPDFRIRIDCEIMLVTGVAAGTWTVTRAAEGTTATAHCQGAVVSHILTAGALTNLNASYVTTGVFSTARLGSGTPTSSKFLRGDGSWENPGTVTGSIPALNYAFNGGFDLVQRQPPDTLTTIAEGGYGPDRWMMRRESDGFQYQRLDATSESGLSSKWYGRFKKITNAGKILICQIIPNVESLAFNSPSCVFQLAMRSNAARAIHVEVFEWRGTADAVDTSVNTWNADSTRPTFTSANLVSTFIPADPHSVTTSWVTTYYGFGVPTSACRNLVLVIFSDADLAADATLDVAQASLSLGTLSFTDRWRPQPQGEVLQQCQRFFQKSFALDTAPATSVGAGTGEAIWTASNGGASSNPSPKILFPVPMRTTPTVTLYNPAAANNEARDRTAAGNCSATSAEDEAPTGFYVQTTGNAGTGPGNVLAAHWDAAAEL